MGGGPSLAKSLDQCPASALYLSVNDHGARLLKDRPKLAPRTVSYIIACDNIEERARADLGPRDYSGPRRDGAPWNIPVVSRHMWADYRLPFMPAPNSGMAAAWLARFMGCAPIILTGMDLWIGATYHDSPKSASSGRTCTDRQHFERWSTLLNRYPAQYRIQGCSPLFASKCAHYDPSERADPPIDREALLEELQTSWCRLTRETDVSKRVFAMGEILELHRGEVNHLVKKNIAVRIKPGEAVR
jgi:hypothetical protein